MVLDNDDDDDEDDNDHEKDDDNDDNDDGNDNDNEVLGMQIERYEADRSCRLWPLCSDDNARAHQLHHDDDCNFDDGGANARAHK